MKLPIIEFRQEGYDIKAKIGTFIEAVFVEDMQVFQNRKEVTNQLDPDTVEYFKQQAVIKFKELK